MHKCSIVVVNIRQKVWSLVFSLLYGFWQSSIESKQHSWICDISWPWICSPKISQSFLVNRFWSVRLPWQICPKRRHQKQGMRRGVGIGGLYGDTLIRSFPGRSSNHRPHIKLSSLPIASKVRVYQFFPIPFRRGRSAGLPPSVVLL